MLALVAISCVFTIQISAKLQLDSSCDFENATCSWLNTNSLDIGELLNSRRNSNTFPYPEIFPPSWTVQNEYLRSKFHIVLSSERNISNHHAYFSSLHNKNASGGIPMIVSRFYEHTNSKCDLSFRYRILGEPQAELLITTEQLSSFVSSKYYHHNTGFNSISSSVSSSDYSIDDDDDWIRPTLRSRFKPIAGSRNDLWTSTRVPLGMFSYPTRIRIECHSGTSEPNEEFSGSGEVECYIDDIQLVNCEEEVWQSDTCSDTKTDSRFLCTENGINVCLKSEDVCDMHIECDNGLDEDETMHECLSVPNGARCNFEDVQFKTGCQNWQFYSIYTNQSLTGQEQRGQLVELTNSENLTSLQRNGIPPNEYNFHGKIYRPNHYLFWSSLDAGLNHNNIGNNEHEIVYTYAQSGFFTSFGELDPFPLCALRFFYCRSGSAPFQIFLVLKDKTDGFIKLPLWSPPKNEHVTNPCSWHKGIAAIRSSMFFKNGKKAEYAIRLSFAKIIGSLGTIAIDALTLSPSCFFDNTQTKLLPDQFSATSCGHIGANMPTEEACHLEHTGSSLKETHYTGLHRWKVPATREYRIEVYGASGGIMPGQTVNNRGGAVLANIQLSAGSEISMIIGQVGLCPCDYFHGGMAFSSRNNWEKVCSTLGRINETSAKQSDPIEIVGCGGGGATVFFYNGKPLITAGGGGGSLFLKDDDTSIQSISRRVAEGGYESAENETLPLFTPANYVSGRGASLIQLNESKALKICDDCGIMDGKFINSTVLLAGTCPTGSTWNLTGGYGGGGAACGPGGGGGGGYKGGSGFYMNFGGGGSSAWEQTEGVFISKSGYNFGNGKIRMEACPQHLCPGNSNCTFEKPQIEIPPKAYCVCFDGERIPLSAMCSSREPLHTLIIDSLINQHFIAVTLTILLSILVACLLLFCLARFCHRRNKLAHSNNIHELLDIVETDSTLTRSWVGNKITGNPIYETVHFSECKLSELPCISRQTLKLERVIGHGAFGEVYEGTLFYSDGQNIKVAIKSLLTDSARGETTDDFEMEARLLSQFKHENIVAFYGVSFEQHPKYIVLEYLEGGDLKNFLRESRPRMEPSITTTPSTPTTPQSASNLLMIDLVIMALDVARGCEHLEATHFVHRDIAARNCLLTAKSNSPPNVRRVVKIADFGMARDIYRNDYYRKGGKAFLPVRWMPPESFLDGIFTSKTDVWAFGILLWEIFSMGYVPYSGRENHEVMKLVVAGDRLESPVGVIPEIYELMLWCWTDVSEKRPRFSDIVKVLVDLLKREDLQSQPLPPIRHKLLERSVSATPSTIGLMLQSDMDNQLSTTSQTTEITVLSSDVGITSTALPSVNGSFTSYDSMPTAGVGVSRSVFPPYKTKFPEPPLMNLEPPAEKQGTAALDSPNSSGSSHDSTLHESAASIRLNHHIRKPSNSNNNNNGNVQRSPQSPSIITRPKIIPKMIIQQRENTNLLRKQTPPLNSAIPLALQGRKSSLPISLSPLFVENKNKRSNCESDEYKTNKILKTMKMCDLLNSNGKTREFWIESHDTQK